MSNQETLFDGMLGSLSGLTEAVAVTTCKKDSTGVSLRQEAGDHIYGLLSKDVLTAEEVSLLSVLTIFYNKECNQCTP